MAFGRDLERRLFEQRPGRALSAVLAGEPARMELVGAAALRAEAAAVGLAAARGSAASRGDALLVQSMLLKEHARRTGAPEDLAKAADAAEKAVRLLDGADAGAARMELVQCALLAAELFGDAAALAAAEARLAVLDAQSGTRPTVVAAARRDALGARVAAVRAQIEGDLDLAIVAAEQADRAVTSLDRLAQGETSFRSEAALARVVRAELLTGFAVRLKEATLAAQAADDLVAVAAGLDPDATPLTFARVETMRGEALSALGELTGDAGALAEAVDALEAALQAAPAGWSPVDRARAARAQALARQALAEAADEPALFDAAAAGFDMALAELDGAAGLPLRAACAFDRALALARRAEQLHDARALDWAEGALKARLAAYDPVDDPVAWAALQVALARIYTVRGQAAGGTGGGAQAALALEAAVEVFTERGLKSLAEQALAMAI